MRSLTSTVRTATNKVVVIIGRTVLLVLAVLAGLVLWGLLVGTVADAHSTVPVQAPPIDTPSTDASGMAPHERPASGDGYADHHLFDPEALLDTRQIDDLRDDPAGACIAEDKIYTASGSCLVAVYVLPDEVPAEVWQALRSQGYDYWVDDRTTGSSDADLCDAIWVPEGAMVATGEGVWSFTDEGPILRPFDGR